MLERVSNLTKKLLKFLTKDRDIIVGHCLSPTVIEPLSLTFDKQ